MKSGAPFLHNAGKTANSRLTSWTTNSDVAIHYALYSNGEGGTIFSIRQGFMQDGMFNYTKGGNLFRLDRHLHPKSPDIPLWHYHYRWTIDGITRGSNAPRSISIPLKKTIKY